MGDGRNPNVWEWEQTREDRGFHVAFSRCSNTRMNRRGSRERTTWVKYERHERLRDSSVDWFSVARKPKFRAEIDRDIGVDARACRWIGCLFGAVLNRESKQIDTSRVSGEVIDWLRGGEKEFLAVRYFLLFVVDAFSKYRILTCKERERETLSAYELKEDGLEWNRDMSKDVKATYHRWTMQSRV